MPPDQAAPSHFIPDSIWVDYSRLGALENVAEEMMEAVGTRKRASKFRGLVGLLKGLKLIPRGADVKRVGFAVNYLGQLGLVVEFLPAEQVISTVPSNFAQERKDACSG